MTRSECWLRAFTESLDRGDSVSDASCNAEVAVCDYDCARQDKDHDANCRTIWTRRRREPCRHGERR